MMTMPPKAELMPRAEMVQIALRYADERPFRLGRPSLIATALRAPTGFARRPLARCRSAFRLRSAFGLRALRFGLAFPRRGLGVQTLRQFGTPGTAIPFLVGLRRNLAF